MSCWSACSLVLALALALGPALPALGQPGGPPPLSSQGALDAPPPILDRVGIDARPGSQLPREAMLTGSDGRHFILGEYADREKPLVLVLAYYRCPMLCSLVLSGMTDALKGLGKTAGKDFRVLVVSFDPRDTTAVADGKRSSYLGAYGRDVDRAGFEFATGDEPEVRRIADAVGFRYEWDEAQQQYAHAAGIFVITPDGKVSETMLGVQFRPADVDAALDAASKGVWRSALKGPLLYCFHFDPRTGKYVPVALQFLKVGAALTLAVLAGVVAWLLRLERRRKRAEAARNQESPPLEAGD